MSRRASDRVSVGTFANSPSLSCWAASSSPVGFSRVRVVTWLAIAQTTHLRKSTSLDAQVVLDVGASAHCGKQQLARDPLEVDSLTQGKDCVC